MAFLDKLGGMAKNLSDKASDTVTTTKLNAKIKVENAAIVQLQQQIGEYYYQQHAAGQACDPAVAELLAAIDGHNAAIAELQAEIAHIQAENAIQAQQPAAMAAPIAAPAQGNVCGTCGQENPAGTRFCSGCGSKLEEAPVPRICACGAPVPPGTKFCGGCGTRFE